MRRFKVCMQHDAMQCGIACLRMVCLYYGVKHSMDSLSRLCLATTEGVSLLGMSDAAERLGLHTVCGRVGFDQIAEAPLPCILHWNQNHFVVLYRIRRGCKKFYIADPAKGLVTCTREEMKEHWVCTRSDGGDKGIAMFMETTPAFYSRKENGTQEDDRSLRFLFGYVKKYKKNFGQIAIGLLLGCVIQLILPFLTQAIVDEGIKGKDIGFIWLILFGQLMLTISSTALDFIRRWLLLHINMRVNVALVSDFFIKLLRLPMSFFDTKLTGDILQRMGDHSRVNSFLTGQTLNVMFSMLSLIVFSVVLLMYNKVIFVIYMAGSAFYVAWIMMFMRRRKTLDYELFEQQAINKNKTYEFITCMQEIKLQDCRKRVRWEWEDTQADLFAVQMKSQKLQQAQEAGSIFINELKNMIVTVVAATSVIHGELTFGMMLAVQYIIGRLNGPIEQLMGFIYSVQDVKISLERINEIHHIKDENADGHESTLKEEPHSIKLDNVSFKYDAFSPKKIIDGVSIDIPKGKVTAIVGASGSGKTTLIKLMLGYYPVNEGHIIIGDTDIAHINLDWWRRQCGVVMQDGVVFSGTIARNIAIDDNDIDKERMIRAAEIACIKDYVMSLPLKFDTKIGHDGMGLSQGQKQRILIARAVYKDPYFIFLDEATNSLDADNERMIVGNLANFYCGRTVVIVAHRLSTVSNADRIIVLHDGRIAESGTHNELVKKGGMYYHLVKNQLELGT